MKKNEPIKELCTQQTLTERIERLEHLVGFLGGKSLNPQFTDAQKDKFRVEISDLFSETFPDVPYEREQFLCFLSTGSVSNNMDDYTQTYRGKIGEIEIERNSYPIQTNSDGRRFVVTKDGDTIFVDEIDPSTWCEAHNVPLYQDSE